MKFYDFLLDPNLGNLGAPSFATWHIVARLLDGDARLLDDAQLAIARQITGRESFPDKPVKRFYAGLGRRSGKTLFESRRAAYFLAKDYRDRLAPGEYAVVASISPTTRQAALLFDYTKACILASPFMAPMLDGEGTSTTLAFKHRTSLEVHPASFRSLRGPTFAAVLLDEASYLRNEDAAVSDTEIARAVTPGVATLDGSLEVFSSLYMKKGLMFTAHRKIFGNDDSAELYVQGETRLFNPTIPQSIIDTAYEDDAESAAAEWGGQFRSDLSAALDPAWIDAAVESDVFERARTNSTLLTNQPIQYVAFTDPAGGGGKDSWCTRVVHLDGKVVFDDAALEIRPPFSTADAAEKVATFLKGYGITSVRGDAYAGEWPADALKGHGIHYTRSELNKSQIYLEAIPLFSSGRIRLLDHARTVSQLRQLERRTRSGGKDSIDHPGGASDDNANALAGAAVHAARRPISDGQTCKAFTSTAFAALDGMGSDYADSRRRQYDGQPQSLWPTDFN